MRKHKLILALCGMLAVLAGCCGREELSPTGEGEVAVHFGVADANPAITRALFDADVPVRVLVFRRTNTAQAADVTATPYRTFDTTTDGAGGLNPDAGGKPLSVMSGFTYDFYALANPPSDELSAASWNIPHGTDLLTGAVLGKAIVRGTATETVDFGDLPHLGSQLIFTAYPSSDLFDEVTVDSFSVSSVTWSKLPAWGSFALGQSKITTANAYTGSFTLTPEQPVGTSPDFVVEDAGVVLPFPAAYTATTNRIDIRFAMELNGGGVLLDAEDVIVPAFLPGYSYKFILELQYNQNRIDLLLTVTPWDVVDWDSGMGDMDGSMTVIKLGSWDGITWRSGMGGDDDVMTILYPGVWNSATWVSIMGEN